MSGDEKKEEGAPPATPGEVVRAWFSPAAWALALAFAVGGAGMTLNSLVVSNQDLRRRFDEHERLPSHAGSDLRLQSLERRVDGLERSHHEMANTVNEKLDKVNTNLAALCAATRGAQCR